MKDISRLLDWIPYIYYPLCFQKNIVGVKPLINSGSEINTITPEYALKLGPKTRLINIRAQKIDCSFLKMFEMVFASFQVKNKPGKARFF